MKGLMGYLDCRVSGLHFPLCAVIDYRGFSLIAQSVVPVTKNTILYGSADGGHTVHCDDHILNAKMHLAATMLNLKGHYVYSREVNQKVFLSFFSIH